jgi:hypothetical protein
VGPLVISRHLKRTAGAGGSFFKYQGEVLENDGSLHLLWWFSTPIMHQTRLMGTAYTLYDMTRDRKLLETIAQTVSGDVSVVKSGQKKLLLLTIFYFF